MDEEVPVVLVPTVTVFVHQSDAASDPGKTAGWRWAVMVGGRGPVDLRFCAQAGWAHDEPEATIIGEFHGLCAVQALRILGIPAQYNLARLDYDPIPPGVDPVNIV